MPPCLQRWVNQRADAVVWRAGLLLRVPPVLREFGLRVAFRGVDAEELVLLPFRLGAPLVLPHAGLLEIVRAVPKRVPSPRP